MGILFSKNKGVNMKHFSYSQKQVIDIKKLYTKIEKKFTGFGIFLSIILFPIGILLGFLVRRDALYIRCEIFYEDGTSADMTISEDEYSFIRNKIRIKSESSHAA